MSRAQFISAALTNQWADSPVTPLAGCYVTNFHKQQGQLEQSRNGFMPVIPCSMGPSAVSLLFDKAKADGILLTRLSSHIYNTFPHLHDRHPSITTQLYLPLPWAKRSVV